MQKTKLVLPGTAALFPAIIGMIRGCEQLGIEFSAMAGTSGGALITALYASGYNDSYKLESIVTELGPVLGKTIKPSIRAFLSDGILDTRHLHKALQKYLVPTIGEAQIPIKIVTTNLNAKKASEAARIWCSEADSDKSLPLLVSASSAMEFIMPSVQIGEELHGDGGWLKNFAADIFGENTDVIGVRLNADLDEFKLAPKWRPIKRRAQFMLRLIELQIAHNVHEDTLDAKGLRLIPVKTTHKSLDFDLTEDKIRRMIREGLAAVYANKGLLL